MLSFIDSTEFIEIKPDINHAKQKMSDKLDHCIFAIYNNRKPQRTSFGWSGFHIGLNHGKNMFSPATN